MNNNYFIQLREQFKNDPHCDRFLQELQDHAQDLESELPKNKSLTFDIMKKQFGEPKQVKKVFNAIVRPWETLFFILEGLFYGILMIPFAFMGTDMIRSLMIDGGFLNPILIILPLIWFAIYFLAFKRYSGFNTNLKHALWIWIVLITGPTLIHTLLFFIDAASLSIELYPVNRVAYLGFNRLILAIAGFLIPFVLVGFLGWFGHIFSSKKRPKMTMNHKEKFKKIVFIYILSFLVLRTLVSYFGFFDPNTPFYLQVIFRIIYFPFSPLVFVEFIFWLFFQGIFGNQAEASLFFNLYFPGITLLFLGFQSLIHVVHQKSWRSGRFLMLIYVLSLFFISTKPFEIHPDYQVPIANSS